MRGNTIVSGYYNNPEASAAAIDAEGWFGTGDVAKISPEGFLTITDRAKDLIKSGGEWISSIDVENMALGHPDIANCAVIVRNPSGEIFATSPVPNQPSASIAAALASGLL